MHEKNPWKTPFGKLLIGSSLVALLVGFSLAAGFAGYFKTQASPPDDNLSSAAESSNAMENADSFAEPADSAPQDAAADQDGYAAALHELQAPASSENDLGNNDAASNEKVNSPDNAGEAANEAEQPGSEGY